MQQHQGTTRTRRPVISDQTETFVRMMQERLETYNGDSSERELGHYDGLIEALAIMMRAQIGGQP